MSQSVKNFEKVLYYAIGTILDPEAWFAANKDTKDAEKRYHVRVELKSELNYNKVPSNIAKMSPMVPHGYGTNPNPEQNLFAGFTENGDVWILPVAEVVSLTEVRLVNGQTLKIHKGETQVSEASKTWEEVAEEVRTARKLEAETRHNKLQAELTEA